MKFFVEGLNPMLSLDYKGFTVEYELIGIEYFKANKPMTLT